MKYLTIIFIKRSSAYGVTTSYTKTFIWAKELIFGDGGYLWRIEPGDSEIHVDRTDNVSTSEIIEKIKEDYKI